MVYNSNTCYNTCYNKITKKLKYENMTYGCMFLVISGVNRNNIEVKVSEKILVKISGVIKKVKISQKIIFQNIVNMRV